MKKLILLTTALFMMLSFNSCGSDDEPKKKTPTISEIGFNINRLQDYYGVWVIEWIVDENGKYSKLGKYSDYSWDIRNDGIFYVEYMRGTHSDYKYTFSNGVFHTALDGKDALGYTQEITYKFEENDMYTLKATVTETSSRDDKVTEKITSYIVHKASWRE